jgi:hypothetical protein
MSFPCDALLTAPVRSCAAAGLVAGLAWRAAEPRLRRLFGQRYSDPQLLTSFITRGRYLGRLVDETDKLYSDMSSRVEVGRVLRESGVQTLEFRASIVIGAGGFSFELIRRMVEWLPVIALPDGTNNLAQPIALADVVSYLAEAAEADVDGSRAFEIGGGEQITYRRLIESYADATATRTATVSVPVLDAAAEAASRVAAPLTDRLPGEAQEALKLFESLRHTTVVRDPSAERFEIRPMNVDAAIAAARRDEA